MYGLAVEETLDHSVIKGTILILWFRGSVAWTLVDARDSHSSVSYALVRTMRLRLKTLRTPPTVTSPAHKNIVLDHICRACTMVIPGCGHSFDLIFLDIVELDVIIRMNWLINLGAIINCYAHRMTFVTLEGARLQLQCDRLFTRRTKPMDALIASLWSEDTNTQAVVFPRVVWEYADVFLNELLGLPPCQVIEVAIETLPGTSTIALSMYRMAPAEPAEMQVQMAELERLGFIYHSIFP